MMIDFQINDLKCVCAGNDAGRRIVYMVYPLVDGFSDLWLQKQSEDYGCSIVVVYVPLDKWNDYLTPWPEPGETPKAQPFAGEGASFLSTLRTMVIPEAEKRLAVGGGGERDLVGVSLAGLFTFWEWMQCDTFRSIACLSGSFWYMGFMDWLDKLTIPRKQGKAYFLLGTDEPKSRIKAYRTVGENTEAVVGRLKEAGVDTTFEWVPGNHFADPLLRAEKALAHLCRLPDDRSVAAGSRGLTV